jgi:hypothetical protein
MNRYSATFWPRANHHPVSHDGQVASIHGFVPELARNFREYLSMLGVDAEEIFVFERDSATRISASRI